jgi:hypothetical protein
MAATSGRDRVRRRAIAGALIAAGLVAAAALWLSRTEALPAPALAIELGLEVAADDAALAMAASALTTRLGELKSGGRVERRGEHLVVTVPLDGAAERATRLLLRRRLAIREIDRRSDRLCRLVRAVRAGVASPRMAGIMATEGAPGTDCQVTAVEQDGVAPAARLGRLVDELVAEGALPAPAPGHDWFVETVGGREARAHYLGPAIDRGALWLRRAEPRWDPAAAAFHLAVALSPAAEAALASRQRAGLAAIAIVQGSRLVRTVRLAEVRVPGGLDVTATRPGAEASRAEMTALARALEQSVVGYLAVVARRPAALQGGPASI